MEGGRGGRIHFSSIEKKKKEEEKLTCMTCEGREEEEGRKRRRRSRRRQKALTICLCRNKGKLQRTNRSLSVWRENLPVRPALIRTNDDETTAAPDTHTHTHPNTQGGITGKKGDGGDRR